MKEYFVYCDDVILISHIPNFDIFVQKFGPSKRNVLFFPDPFNLNQYQLAKLLWVQRLSQSSPVKAW